MLATVVCALLALLFLCAYSCIKPKRFPPGPNWLPFIGSLVTVHRLKRKRGYFHLAFEELSQTYGPLVGLKMGKQKFLVISSHDLIKSALLRDEFNGRPSGFFFRFRSFGKEKGVLFTEGSIWAQHRKFTLRHLRNFGLGQTEMTDKITWEAQCLVDHLLEQSKIGPVPMHTAFDIAVLNSLWVMFAGHRFDYQDVKVKSILNAVHEIFRISDSLGGMMSHMPFLRFIIPELSGYKDLLSIHEKLWTFLGEEISNHKADLEPEQPPRDLIDAFLREIDARREDPAEDQTIFDHENLLILCLDLFLAGSKTTTDTLATIFAFLAANPQHVEELQNEMESVLGKDRPPRLSDAPSLPKIEAFLAEAQRSLILAPLGVPHKAIKDVTFNGYRIPKDTIVLMNFHSAHNDANHWDTPDDFRPRRFLDDEGKFKNSAAFMPFGAGKRRCLGEIIARSSLFLLFTHVLRHFDLEISPEHGRPDPRGYDGFTISPKPYYLVLKSRFQGQ